MSATVLKSASVTIAAVNDAATVIGFPSTGAVAVQVVGSMSATITFEVTVDGTNWVAFNMTPSNSGTDASTASAAGAFSKATLGFAGFRARCSAYTSGSPVVTVRYTAG
jgi:phage head maturation protease